MSATLDSASSIASSVNVTTLTTPAFTISGAANKAAMGMLSGFTDITGAACTLGADPAMTAITNAPNTTANTTILGRITALSGSQTAVFTWTTAQPMIVGVIVAKGVNQATPFNNGAHTSALDGRTALSLAVTSVAGDLTASVGQCLGSAVTVTAFSTNQTQEWSLTTTSGNAGGGDVGPGSGTTTHTWTATYSAAPGSGTFGISGANFVQAPSVAPPERTLLGVGV